MRMCIAMGLVVGLLWSAGAVQGEETLEGTWKLVSGKANGVALTEKQLQDAKLVIECDQYTITFDGRSNITGVQKLGSTAGINTIDITDTSGPHKDQTCLGIYEVKGDEFRVAFAPPGKERPSILSSRSDSGYWFHVWQRVTE